MAGLIWEPRLTSIRPVTLQCAHHPWPPCHLAQARVGISLLFSALSFRVGFCIGPTPLGRGLAIGFSSLSPLLEDTSPSPNVWRSRWTEFIKLASHLRWAVDPSAASRADLHNPKACHAYLR
ncbi:hypothetical protein K431DRAFT_20852 [Polychaeton citri CBS 116435]|uniref:Uncharacterized protein n=1 Tax=Polychaeton citri CBS 116435 TaxID=1314669 RepID=A0A9P4Q0V8_9PEZI|nr:hypothetical protein K431DRAFT_20852 [Polychaeton citri CBS 116435]